MLKSLASRHAVLLSGLRITICIFSQGSGGRSAFASSHGVRIQTSRASSVAPRYGHRGLNALQPLIYACKRGIPMRKLLRGVCIIMPIVANTAPAQPAAPPKPVELNTVLMETTFQVSGPHVKIAGATSTGTGFVVGKPSPQGDFSYFVLVTAAHVFEDVAGDIATITTREKQPDDSYKTELRRIHLRENGKNIYVRHPSVDVAAIYVGLPSGYKNVTMVGDGLLASEADLIRFEIHPGDELLCLGYPLGGAGPYGFPILRSGKIASFPLTPTKQHSNWLFDFRVFPGNSGGPVYLVDRGRMYDNTTHLGETLQMVIGLVTQQIIVDKGTTTEKDLNLGVVIPATFICETMDMLAAVPPPSTFAQ
jgi:hypothetical protein